jgi:hypothetical protein
MSSAALLAHRLNSIEERHTMALQHDTRSGSCMNKEGPDGTQSKNLDGHDMEHLADCYPKTNDYYLTTDCDTYQGHY